MAGAAISVDRVGKKFRRGEQFDSLRDLLAAHVLRRRAELSCRRTEFWALDDVSFTVAPGEAFGIIGPNGAGKSTMLKLLAGIMRPTRGAIETRGRVSALIELGAGFHGDLTGRENIYLNASILGMPRRDVVRRFDEIVDFAGIREFLDTPLKRYSSGMHARLGFAIAAHVDPQVLLVDEVLSVGDRVFRARCMERMGDFLAQGAAVMFVSHDLGAVTRFCQRAMVLARGKTSFCGSSGEAVAHYHQACTESLVLKGPCEVPLARVRNASVCGADGARTTRMGPGEWVSFEYEIDSDVDLPRPSYGFSVLRLEDHMAVYETSSTRLGVQSGLLRAGERRCVRYEFQMNVPPGEYALGLHLRDRDALRYVVEDPYAARVLVVGSPTAGGTAYLDARVRVEPVMVGALETVGGQAAAGSAVNGQVVNQVSW